MMTKHLTLSSLTTDICSTLHIISRAEKGMHGQGSGVREGAGGTVKTLLFRRQNMEMERMQYCCGYAGCDWLARRSKQGRLACEDMSSYSNVSAL
eukprot:6194560-Pleurochrysis_carterae.AAC.1